MKVTGHIINRDFEFNSLSLNLTHERALWHHFVHIAYLTLGGNGLVFVTVEALASKVYLTAISPYADELIN